MEFINSLVRKKRSLKMDPSKDSIDLSSVNSTDVVSDSSHAETLSSLEETSVTSSEHPVVRFVNQNGTRSCNIYGIADVLLALDRIEKNEELTYEDSKALYKLFLLDESSSGRLSTKSQLMIWKKLW
ncbi:unnamed protein product [Lactuca virosa]|uniref:Uncharacterized protein n=1 Tax=Lactuca virosa TaxID=75947 RepID=A0AAU9M5L8_9ASTR|nr:unnamed protein product [Lactuca virosa]